VSHPALPQEDAWRPTLGAWLEGGAVRFRVWAPAHRRVDLLLDPGTAAQRERTLSRAGDGTFGGAFEDVAPGDLYAYLLDGEGPYPDPASRFQPQGVHRPSAVVDARTFRWTDRDWRGRPLGGTVIYELHVGSFTPAGTFAAATDRLPALADLGVTAVELMPVADFPGARNWGYDGVSLFAPSRSYGTPDDLRRLVDAAHGLGLAVLLDVVYNHFGPDGAYFGVFSPFYLSTRHDSPWGPAVNLDGDHSDQVRAFFIENALHWLHEYRMDGLSFDATHAMRDDGPSHLAAQIAMRVRASVTDRTVLLIAEDDRNLATIIKPPADGGWGLDAVWADDFHHQVRRLSAGDSDGYYQDYSGSIADLATTLRQGWFYCGQRSQYWGGPRGTDPAGAPLERMVVCLQNHDQIGNRPFGERLNSQIDPALFRALTALLLFAPETPLLFMGQEWAASTPFLYFTHHHADLGRLVTEGRRAEFSRFAGFADESSRARIPDPQAASTFEASRLKWEERARPPHAGVLELYRALLGLRRSEPALRRGDRLQVVELDDFGLALERGVNGAGALLLIVCLRESGAFDATRWPSLGHDARWALALTTEETRFRDSGGPDREPGLEIDFERGPLVRFRRPSAVILRRP